MCVSATKCFQPATDVSPLKLFHTSKDMERLEPQPVDEDEEEFLVLDPEHVCIFSLNIYEWSMSETNILCHSFFKKILVVNVASVSLVYCVFSALVKV